MGYIGIYPPASKASKEVANLTERKNMHTPVYDVKEGIIRPTAREPSIHTYTHCMSVCDKLWPQFNYPDLHHLLGGMKLATQIHLFI